MTSRHLYRSIAAATALALTPQAVAQTPDETDRFQIERVGEDILRLDRVTGRVELCADAAPTFACRTVVAASQAQAGGTAPPASAEILAQNEALKAENEELKRRLGMVRALVEDAELPDGASRPTRTAEDIREEARRGIDEAVDVTAYAVRRFRDLVTSLTEEGTGRN